MKTLKSLLIPALFPLAAWLTPLSYAGQPTQVVELFTSQGCSSCPPTNALLNDWAGRDDILALTYSVEYWDYLGWKDTFADPKFTARQRAYARAIGHGRVYTPQMVINGAIDKFKFSRAEIDDVTLTANALPITFQDRAVTLPGNPDINAPGRVRLVTYHPGVQTVNVKRGENGGRALTLTNVVTDIADLGDWGPEAATYSVPAAESETAYAVIVQQDENGPIIAAAVQD